MKHIKIFDTVERLNQFKLSQNYITPNVSLCEDNPTVMHYDPYVAPVQHEYVEIGGIKWATMNLGANSVTDYGVYYYWGDTQGYTATQTENLGPEDYKYYDNESYTKYNDIDELMILQSSDDAVTATWGGNWRMPTADEWQILGENTNSAWTNDYQGSGISGVICTDKTDSSKVLFFPFISYGSSGDTYWTSSISTSCGSTCAKYIYGDNTTLSGNGVINDYIGYSDIERSIQLSHIRGILDDRIRPDYVEIGGIKWATMNLGANSVTDSGLYYQWGDTQSYTKQQASNLTLSDYKYYDNGSYTKYNSTDELITLESSDDAVTAALGYTWRMPTISEWQTLDDAVDTEWTDNYQGSGVAGLICTDKTDNTKVLFFPAPNNINDTNYDVNFGNNYNNFGYYWSNSIAGSSVYESGNLIMVRDNNMETNELCAGRYCGCLIRGIYLR